jgi:ABC-2 type transport system ATP-binding protein
MDILRLDNVSKSFGSTVAVKDLSLGVGEGTMFGLLGPNGAGKTTTIRMIMNIIAPDAGAVYVCGSAPTPDILDRVGYLPEERGLYRKMKVRDVLEFFGTIKGLSSRDARNRAARCLERFGMPDVAGKKVEELSKGNQQKIQLIVTVLHDPRLVILDEPFAGLDPINTQLVKDVFLELKAAGCCVIVSTHLMEHVEKLCDSLCLIHRGRSVLDGRLADIKKRFGVNTALIEYDGDGSFLKDLDFVASCDDYGKYVEVRLRDPARSPELLQIAAARLRIRRFELVEPTLHQIFITTVKEAGS